MKVLIPFFFLLMSCLWAAELEVRAYRAEVKDFRYRPVSGDGVVLGNLEGAVYEGISMEKAPFESRFFSEGDGLLDFTGWAKDYGLLEGEQGKAVFNQETGRLVVRAELRDHYFLGDYLEQFLTGQMRFRFQVVKMPGVGLGRLDLSLSKIGKEGVIVGEISGLCQSGRLLELRSPGGELSWEGECQAGFPDTSWFCRSNVLYRVPGIAFELRNIVTGVMGLPTVMELGSYDGISTFVGIWTVKQILVDGSDFDDWVQHEKARNLVMDGRVKGWLHKDKGWVTLENGKRYQRFILPPTFLTVLGKEDGKSENLRDLFEKNGIAFKDDDRVFWMDGEGVLAVEASPVAMEMIEEITMAAGQDGNSGLLGGSYVLVESVKKLEVVDLKKGDFRILRKICVSSASGPTGMKMGKGFLEVEADNEANGDDHFVETRLTLKANGAVVLSTETGGESGVPAILKQEKVGKRWRTWVVTFSARYFAETIKDCR